MAQERLAQLPTRLLSVLLAAGGLGCRVVVGSCSPRRRVEGGLSRRRLGQWSPVEGVPVEHDGVGCSVLVDSRYENVYADPFQVVFCDFGSFGSWHEVPRISPRSVRVANVAIGPYEHVSEPAPPESTLLIVLGGGGPPLTVGPPPLTVSLPLPPSTRSVPPAPSKESLPAWPRRRSLPAFPTIESGPSPPAILSTPSPPVIASPPGPPNASSLPSAP